MRPDRAYDNLVGQVLREIREDLGWSRKDIPGLAWQTLRSYERGERGVSVERFFWLCDIYQTDPRLVLEIIERRHRAAA